ncbi:MULTISPECIES: hypothetical protein [unclassified Streptosporangium]|uniref:hypothetical protein n=1 Tax=unclassified Streptosporangium TaxID=2632669 RepID=UPI002E27E4AD|nr:MULTISPECIES: hypothetical protein [unclassified Streptosporangium]
MTTDGGVRLVRTAEGARTCPWRYDHRGSRGPREHVLAARMAAASPSGAGRPHDYLVRP